MLGGLEEALNEIALLTGNAERHAVFFEVGTPIASLYEKALAMWNSGMEEIKNAPEDITMNQLPSMTTAWQ